MIIGVIASMTIPALKKNAELRENTAKLKKVYSALSTATMLLEEENGPVQYWKWDDDTAVITNMYLKKMNVVKNCKTQGGCYANGNKSQYLNGRDYTDYEKDTNLYSFLTSDGTFFAFVTRDKTCRSSDGEFRKNSCATVHVDVNGGQPPNRIGIDIFGFSVTPDGVYPFGGCPGCNTSDCVSSGLGWSCAAKVIIEGKIDYS